jgi:hypothetical protein
MLDARENNCGYHSLMPSEPEQLAELVRQRDELQTLKMMMEARLASLKTDAERLEVEALSNRAISPGCSFDRKHRQSLYSLALAPDSVGWWFKLRERVHRMVHHH